MRQIATREMLDRAIERGQDFSSGTVAFAAKNLTTGEEILVNADTAYPTASVIKLAILAEVYRQVSEGQLDLRERLLLQESDLVGGSGVLKELGEALQPTIFDTAMLMVIVSDNTATNLLIDRVGGLDPINRTMQRYGLETIILHSPVDFDHIGDDVRRFGEASARDLMQLNDLLLREALIGPEASQAMMDIMRRQQYLDQVPRYFNCRAQDSVNQISVGCKTGFFPGTWADAGFIVLPSGVKIAYCGMVDGSSDRSITPESEPAITNGLLGRAILEYWWPGEWNPDEVTVPSMYVDRVINAS